MKKGGLKPIEAKQAADKAAKETEASVKKAGNKRELKDKITQ
jgi:hypothetical protein